MLVGGREGEERDRAMYKSWATSAHVIGRGVVPTSRDEVAPKFGSFGSNILTQLKWMDVYLVKTLTSNSRQAQIDLLSLSLIYQS